MLAVGTTQKVFKALATQMKYKTQWPTSSPHYADYIKAFNEGINFALIELGDISSENILAKQVIDPISNMIYGAKTQNVNPTWESAYSFIIGYNALKYGLIDTLTNKNFDKTNSSISKMIEITKKHNTYMAAKKSSTYDPKAGYFDPDSQAEKQKDQTIDPNQPKANGFLTCLYYYREFAPYNKSNDKLNSAMANLRKLASAGFSFSDGQVDASSTSANVNKAAIKSLKKYLAVAGKTNEIVAEYSKVIGSTATHAVLSALMRKPTNEEQKLIDKYIKEGQEAIGIAATKEVQANVAATASGYATINTNFGSKSVSNADSQKSTEDGFLGLKIAGGTLAGLALIGTGIWFWIKKRGI